MRLVAQEPALKLQGARELCQRPFHIRAAQTQGNTSHKVSSTQTQDECAVLAKAVHFHGTLPPAE